MYLLPLSTGYVFPDDATSEKEKATPKWGSSVGQAIYSRFCLGGSYGWGYNDYNGLRIIRDYGDGVQPESIYREWYTNGSPIGSANGGIQNTGSAQQNSSSSSSGFSSRHARLMTTQMRAAMTNISYRPYNPVPKFSGTIISMLAENDYFVDCTSVEKGAVDERTRKKLEVLYTSTIINPRLREMGMEGFPVPFEAIDETDIEIAERRGAFKNDIERSIERVAETGFRLNNYKGKIRRKTLKDGIDFNFGCVKLYNDYSGEVKIRYVDVTKLIILWNDNEDAPVAIGDVRLVDIQSIYHDLVAAGYTEDQIKGIANTYRGQQIEQWQTDAAIFERKDPLTGKWTWLDFKVPVLDFEYLSTDYIQYVKGTDKKGKKFYKKNEERVPEKSKSDDREYDEFTCNFWWEGSYIIGTDKVFNWRKKPNQIKGAKLRPMSSYVFDKAINNGQALTQRAIPLCDDLMFAVLKKRAAVWAAAPKGYDIDIGEGANFKIGGQEYSPFDMIHMHRQNGISFRQTKIHAGTGKQVMQPVVERENGLGKQGQEWLAEIAACTYQIGTVFGITDATSAQQDTSGEKTVGVWEGEIAATNHAIHPLREWDREFKAKIAERYVHQVRVNIKYVPESREFYQNQLGEHIIKVLDSIDHTTLSGLGLTMKALPNQKQKTQIMMRAVEMSKADTRNGGAYLTPADVEKVNEYLDNDDVEGARHYMYRREEFNRKESQKMAMESAAQTGKLQQESAIVSEQAKQQTFQLQSTLRLQEIEAEKDKEIAVMEAKYRFETPSKIAQIEAKGTEDVRQMVVEIEGEKQTKTDIKNPS